MTVKTPEQLDARIRERIVDDDFKFLFIDEIQNVRDFEPLINAYREEGRFSIFVTGSNSSFLSEDVATMFRGRADIVRVCPFTFAEYLSAVRKNELAAWKDYMVYGGMPGTLAYAEGYDRKSYLQGLFKTVYFKDILERNAPLADVDVLDHVSEFVMSAVGSLTNPARLTNTMKTVLGLKTDYQVVRRHLGYLKDDADINAMVKRAIVYFDKEYQFKPAC